MALKTALIVDDSKLARITLRKKLDKIGLEVALAESAEQAISMIQENRPDIVFMDHLMPDMDGFEATQEIRTMSGFADLPIVMCSGKDHDTYLQEAQAIGANFTLIKPPTNEALAGIMDMDFSASVSVEDAPVEELTVETIVEDDDQDLISDDMMISDEMDDEILISDDMDGEELATEASILQDQEDASLLDEGLMLDLEDDIPMLEVEETPVDLAADVDASDYADIPVAEVDSDAVMEAIPTAELTVTDLDESKEIPVAEVMLDGGLDAVDESSNDEFALADSPEPAIDNSAIEDMVAEKVASAIADAKIQLAEETRSLLEKQQSLEEQTTLLAAAVDASANTADADVLVDDAAIQAIVDEALASKASEITVTISDALMAQVEELVNQRLDDLPAVDASVADSGSVGVESVDVEAVVTAQLDQRLLEMSEKMALMQQQLEASSALDESLVNEALTALQPVDEGSSSAESADITEQIDGLLAAQLQMQSKIGLPKMLSGVALLLSVVALAGAALAFVA